MGLPVSNYSEGSVAGLTVHRLVTVGGSISPPWRAAVGPARSGERSPRGHGKSELGAAAGRAAHGDRTAVRFHQALDDVEAEAGAAAPLPPPELPEHAW